MLASAVSIVERISLAEDALAAAGADVIETEFGRVVRQSTFPHVYDANLVRRARLRPEALDYALEQLARPLREAGARHLQLTLDGADVPETVLPLLRRRGFARDRLIAMVLPGRPTRTRVPGLRIAPVPADASWDSFARAMDQMNREEPWYAPLVSLEIVGSMRAKQEQGAFQLFVAEDEGRVVGTVGLALIDQTASIFSVGTLPLARGRGIGSSLVVDAAERARRAGADLIYLMARAEDSPKEMYRKLGFEVAFGFDVWLRPPR